MTTYDSYLEAWYRGGKAHNWPLYVGMVILFGIVGLMLIVMGNEHGMDPDRIERVLQIFQWIMVLYIATPVIYALIGIYRHYREVNASDE